MDTSVIVSVPKRFKYTATGSVPGPSGNWTVRYGNGDETTYPLNQGEEVSCEKRHLEGLCEDCEARRVSRMNRDQVLDLYYAGRVSQDVFEAHDDVWHFLNPAGSRPLPTAFPDVLRIAHKILHFHNER